MPLAISLAIMIRSFWTMDAERLLWEGGRDYFRETFPFRSVIGTGCAGIFASLLALWLRPRNWPWPAMATILSLIWTAYWLESYLR